MGRTLIALALLCVGLGFTSLEEIDDLVHASGLFLAEVTTVVENDLRPNDLDLYEFVALRIIKRTGRALPQGLNITKAFGGLWPLYGPPPQIRGPLRPGSLEVGKRYWFATASIHQMEEFPQGVLNWWTTDDARKNALFDEAVRRDLFEWKPLYHPATGLTYGSLEEPEHSRWTVRVTQKGRVLWEKRLSGQESHRPDSWYLHLARDYGKELEALGLDDSEPVLTAETSERLDNENEYGLPAREYYVKYLFHAPTGKRLAVWISEYRSGYVERILRLYELRHGALVLERLQDWMPEGGRQVGANRDSSWVRRIVREFEPSTGRLVKEEFFRFAIVANRSTWVRIETTRR